ncbi:MAG: hypothetical protein IT515_10945 [Burkholderiales bacterium]|nr:hypothetical protein [Burkholderiales bacterium]
MTARQLSMRCPSCAWRKPRAWSHLTHACPRCAHELEHVTASVAQRERKAREKAKIAAFRATRGDARKLTRCMHGCGALLWAGEVGEHACVPVSVPRASCVLAWAT